MSAEHAPSPIFNEDGQLNESVLQEQYGLRANEAVQEVQFGSYSGTLAEALAHPECPIGGIVSTAFAESGRQGVIDKFNAVSMLDPNFRVEFNEEPLEPNQEKKIRPNREFPTT